MKKNDVLQGIITGYGSEGEGVVKSDGFVIFLPFALKGEKVEFKILKVAKNVAYGKLERIIEKSDERVEPQCPVFGKCGGCRLLHMSYPAQLEYKRGLIASSLSKIAFCETEVMPTEPSEPNVRYRNKLQLPLRRVDGRNVVGFFAPDSHRVVETNDCLIQGKWCVSAISAIKEYAEKFDVQFYDESADNGLIKHLLVKKVDESFLVCLVAKKDKIPHPIELAELFMSKLGSRNLTLTLNVNPRRTNAVLGEKTIVLYGSGVVYGRQFGITYGVGTESFIQVNDDVKQKLYRDALLAAIAENPSLVVDAYCGSGLLTALLAEKAKKVVGVEIVREAVDNAVRLAEVNGISNAEFICAPCEEVLPNVVRRADGDAVVVLDPPRKGVDKRFIAALLSSKIKKIVYISCNHATLARDVGLLTEKLVYDGNALVKNVEETAPRSGVFTVESVKGYDMFAGCTGVETLCVLVRS